VDFPPLIQNIQKKRKSRAIREKDLTKEEKM